MRTKSTIRPLALALIACVGSTIAITSAQAQLVVGNDADTGGANTMFVIDLTGANPPRTLISGIEVWGIAADDAARVIYFNAGSTLYRADYAPTGPLTPVSIGLTREGGVTTRAMTALAWDSVDNQLIGRAAGGFYAINPVNGDCTLLFAITAQDFGGLDFDPATNAFYGTNDSTSVTVLPTGRGLYRIDKPWSAPVFTELSNYPGTDADIDGTAAANGRVYLVNDVGSQNIEVWDLGSSAYVAPISNPLSLTGGIFSGGAWAPGLVGPSAGVDVALTITDSPDPIVFPPGTNITYTLEARNLGTDAASNVVVAMPLPSGVTFVSASAPASFDGSTITANFGSLASEATTSFSIVVSPMGTGTIIASANATTSSADTNPANNAAAASTLVRGPQSDLRITINDPADCALGIGGTADYTVTLDILGTETAENVVITVDLPPQVTFVSSIPALTPNGSNQLVLALGSVPVNSGGTIAITATVNTGGTSTMNASAATTTIDPNPANNTASNATFFQASPPTAAIRGVFSTVAASTSSEVPGLGGTRFSSSGGIDRPWKSPSGERFIITADTDLATTSDDLIIVGSDSNFSVGAQEGVTIIPDSNLAAEGSFATVLGINDAGQYSFSGTDAAATSMDAYVAKWDGTQFVTVARESMVVPAFGNGEAFGATFGSATIRADGSVSFMANMTPVGTTDRALFRDDGTAAVARKGVDIPADQFGDASFTYKAFDSGSVLGAGFFMSADGLSWSATGTVNDSVTTADDVGVFNGAVKIQENVTLPGGLFPQTTAAGSPLYLHTESNGDWHAYGSNTGGQDWVLRNAALLAATDSPIFAGSTELYDDAPYAQCFFLAIGNNNGDFVIGGTTNSTTDRANAVLVLNNATVLMRENDPIDLDGNGTFDDDTYIRTFRDDQAFLSDDGELYVVVRLRSGLAASCGGTDTDIGQALVRINIGNTGPTCDYDFNQDENVDLLDAQQMAQVFVGLISPEANWLDGDLNGDENADLTDAQILAAYVVSGQCNL